MKIHYNTQAKISEYLKSLQKNGNSYEIFLDSIIFIPLQKKYTPSLSNSLAVFIRTNSSDKYFIIYVDSIRDYKFLTNEDISNELWDFNATPDTLVIGSNEDCSSCGLTITGSDFRLFELKFSLNKNPYQLLIDLELIKSIDLLHISHI